MKKIRISFAAALLAFALAGSASAQPAGSPVATHGQLSVKNGKIVNKDGDPVALRGMSFYWDRGDWNGHMFYTAGSVNTLAKDWKVDIVRAAFSGPNGSVQRIKTVVDAAIANGIYVILDYHSHSANNEVQGAKDFFSAFMNDPAYAGKPNFLYEIFNEPVGSDKWEDDHKPYWNSTVKPYAETMIDHIRGKDANNLILVGTPFYCLKLDAAIANPITGSRAQNIAYTFHFYSAEHLTDKAGPIAAAVQAGHAVFVSEFGTTEASGKGRYGFDECDKWFAILDPLGVGWANWSVSAFEASSALTSGNGDGTGWQTSQSGAYIKGKLAQYASTVNLTVNKVGQGTVTREGANAIKYGTTLTLRATPAQGWEFAGWSGSLGTSTADSISMLLYNPTTVTATFVQAGNLVKNGNFATGVSNWNVSTQNSGAGTREFENPGARITVTATGSANPPERSVRFTQTGIALELGKKYKLTFDAKTVSGSRTLYVKVNNSASTREYLSAEAELSTTMKPFEFEFGMSSQADANAMLAFNCGNQTGSWVINNVRLEEVGAASSARAVSAASRTSWSLARASGGVSLLGPADAGAAVSLYDVRGRAVKTVRARSGMELGAGVPSGSYILVVRDGAGREVLRSKVLMAR